MTVLLQIAAAVALIALMIGLRILSNRAIFRFRMKNGYRAHDCDGSCTHHGQEDSVVNEASKRN